MRKLIANEDIQSIIYKIRGVDVMLDSATFEVTKCDLKYSW